MSNHKTMACMNRFSVPDAVFEYLVFDVHGSSRKWNVGYALKTAPIVSTRSGKPGIGLGSDPEIMPNLQALKKSGP
jgi:hypothetical protein